MRMRRFRCAMLCVLLVPLIAHADKQKKPCITPDQANKHINQDVCVDARVYDVVTLPDGTRFLDVCTPGTPDSKCRFTIISLRQDHDTVGDLQKFRDANIEIRGIVQTMHGRTGMLLSHARQFYGGPPKFRPNPVLARGFTGDTGRTPIQDPNLRRQGGHRSSLNNKEQETKPTQ